MHRGDAGERSSGSGACDLLLQTASGVELIISACGQPRLVKTRASRHEARRRVGLRLDDLATDIGITQGSPPQDVGGARSRPLSKFA